MKHHKIGLALAVASCFAQNQVVEGAEVSAAPAVPLPVLKTESKEANYHFKKEKIKDAEGKVVGEGKKLPTIKTSIPVPTEDAILDIVAAGSQSEAGKKGLELLKDLMFDVVFERGRQIINAWREDPANAGKEVPADLLKPADLDFFAIASLPKAERRGLGISEEEWDAFFENYREVMPLATGKDKERIEKHVQLFKKKFATVRNDKKVLGVLADMLTLYAASTPNLEDHQGVYEYLTKRVETLLKEDEKVLADAL